MCGCRGSECACDLDGPICFPRNDTACNRRLQPRTIRVYHLQLGGYFHLSTEQFAGKLELNCQPMCPNLDSGSIMRGRYYVFRIVVLATLQPRNPPPAINEANYGNYPASICTSRIRVTHQFLLYVDESNESIVNSISKSRISFLLFMSTSDRSIF